MSSISFAAVIAATTSGGASAGGVAVPSALRVARLVSSGPGVVAPDELANAAGDAIAVHANPASAAAASLLGVGRSRLICWCFGRAYGVS
jgi:hypothetical protein